MRIILIMLALVFTSGSFAASKGKRKIIYKYKKYEKFDFSDMIIGGDSGSPGDLSVIPRSQRGFSNKLPYRSNFKFEIRKSTENIR